MDFTKLKLKIVGNDTAQDKYFYAMTMRKANLVDGKTLTPDDLTTEIAYLQSLIDTPTGDARETYFASLALKELKEVNQEEDTGSVLSGGGTQSGTTQVTQNNYLGTSKPSYDSGWVDISLNQKLDLFHNLGELPAHFQVFVADDGLTRIQPNYGSYTHQWGTEGVRVIDITENGYTIVTSGHYLHLTEESASFPALTSNVSIAPTGKVRVLMWAEGATQEILGIKPDYDSGWFPIDKANHYTKDHTLGETPMRFETYIKTPDGNVHPTWDTQVYQGSWRGFGVIVYDFTSSNYKVITGAESLGLIQSSHSFPARSNDLQIPDGSELRVLMWKEIPTITSVSQINYSTNEQYTGRKWIDGKKIYSRTIDFGNVPADAYKIAPGSIIGNLSEIIKIQGAGKDASNQWTPWPSSWTGDAWNGMPIYVPSEGVKIYSPGVAYQQVYITMEYTKTT